MLPLRDGVKNIVLLRAGLQGVGGGVRELLLDVVLVDVLTVGVAVW